jgi:hypothetical protein
MAKGTCRHPTRRPSHGRHEQ